MTGPELTERDLALIAELADDPPLAPPRWARVAGRLLSPPRRSTGWRARSWQRSSRTRRPTRRRCSCSCSWRPATPAAEGRASRSRATSTPRTSTRCWSDRRRRRARARAGAACIQLMAIVDEPWAAQCVADGLSSGEGLIHAVRDPDP